MARPPRQRLPRLPSQPWRVGDRFELRYDYRTEGLSLQAGALGTITLLPAPTTSAAYVVFDSEPTHAPVPVARAALARIARPPRPNPCRRKAPAASRIAASATRVNPQWLNPPEVYENAGLEAGRSARHGDAATARQWRDWMGRAVKLERQENRTAAQALYDGAYKKAAAPRGPISNPAKRKAPRAAAASRPVRVARRELNAAVELFHKFREAPPRRVRLARFKVPKVCVVIGEMDFVGYTTTHARKRARYRHDFSRGARPLLCASSDGRQLLIFGGNYDFTRDGIVDRA